MNLRQVFQYFVYAAAIPAMASVVLAAKPAPPPSIVATTTDQDFLNNVVGKVSSQTVFDLAISVSGTGTHYRYKIGPSVTTNPNDLAGYSTPIPEATHLTADISSQPDGDFVLCLQGLQIDRKGNIKYVQASPTVYSWTKLTNVAPTLAWIEPDGSNDAISAGTQFTLKWEDADPDDNALIAFYFGDTFMSRFIGVVDEDPDGTADELAWDTTGVAPGIYFVCAHLTDSQTTRTVWSTHPVIIGSPPEAAWSWQPESLVGVGSVGYQTYQVAMDEYGHGMAVGTYLDDRGWVLNYSVYDGIEWSPGVDIVTHPAELDTVPILRSRGLNQYLLVYVEDPIWPDLTAPANVKAIFFDGSNWDAAPQLIDEVYDVGFELDLYVGSARDFNYDAACSPDGTAMVVWREISGTICTRFFNGDAWEPEISHGPGVQPTVAADDIGNYMLAYAHGDTNAADEGMVYYMHFDGITWTPEQRLNVHSEIIGTWNWEVGEDGPVRLAGTGDNKFVAVYSSQVDSVDLANGAGATNLYGRYFNGNAWETEALLDNQPGAFATESATRLAMAADGSALVVWSQVDGDNPADPGSPDATTVVYASSLDGTGNWAAVPTKLSYNTYGSASNEFGGLAIDALGNGIATFSDAPYSDCRSIVKSHYIAGAGWQLQSVDDPLNQPSDREALLTALSRKNRMAGQADGKAVILLSPYSNTYPLSNFCALEYGD